jgi:hypothetical protein
LSPPPLQTSALSPILSCEALDFLFFFFSQLLPHHHLMFFIPKPNPTAPQSLFYQQSQTPQKPFTQKLTHQNLPQTTPQNISVFLTPSPETSEPSSQNPHQFLSLLATQCQ